MTSGIESSDRDAAPRDGSMTPVSRRSLRRTAAMRVPAASTRPATRPTPRWSRRRRVLGVFAGVAALGFAAAYIAPMTAAVSAANAQTVTLYADSMSDVQTLGPGTSGSAPAEFARGGYEVYVAPKPAPVPAATTSSSSSSSTSGAAALSRPYYTGGGSAAEWMAAAGIAESDWGYVDYIVKKESGWNPNATNRSSGACGLVQALPCSKVPGNGYDPVDNLRWGSGYATSRYGGWAGAYSFWVSNNWW